jgi:hypothetical protein
MIETNLPHEFKTTNNTPSVTFIDFSKIPFDIVCNGFSIKDIVTGVLRDNLGVHDDAIEKIAEEIKEAFAVKLRLKQG